MNDPAPPVEQTAQHVRRVLSGDSSHDWSHVERVWENARAILESEPGADAEVVELGALLHDIADWKFHDGDLDAGPAAARAWLNEIDVPAELTEQVVEIVARVSFKGAGVPDEMPTLEGQIVQDADRLDALGAIGIARAFAYGGHRGRPLYDRDERAVQHESAAAYMASTSSTVSHFHEKLLLLAERMHTAGGRQLASGRHAYIVGFLEQLEGEISGER
ncbi:MAG TPA: HD domain-containing protein [Solirubrobacteraceae bacterium]|nr:HD domain-containing protein [Solirubrobacteraceae bacterium]